MADVGLSVIKGVANGVAPATLPDTNSLGLLFRRKRGVPNIARIYGSVAEDQQYFGGSESGLYAPEVVKNLFDNAGAAPVKLHGVRVVADDAAAATATVTDATSGFSIALKGGYENQEDPGDWLNDYVAEVGIEASSNTAIEEPYYFILKDPDGNIVETIRSTTWAGLVSGIENTSKYVMPSGTPTANGSVPDEKAGLSGITTETYSTYNNGKNITFFVPAATDLSLLAIGRKVYYDDTVDDLIGTIQGVSTFPSGPNQVAVNINLASGSPGSPAGKARNVSALLFGSPSSGNATFSAGSDGTEVEADFYGALSVLNPYYIKAAAVVDAFSISMVNQGQVWAEANNSFFLSVLPFESTDSTKQSYKDSVRNATEPGLALYDLWVKVYSEAVDTQVWVPGIGAIMGAGFIRVPANNNDFIHTPPAGVGSAIENISDYAPKALSQTEVNTHVQDWGINVARFIDGLGLYLASSRTVSSNPLYHSIHTILQANYYKRALQDSLAWAEQQPITSGYDAQVVGFLNAFFATEYENEALENSIPFNEACTVISGASINPPSQDRKIRNFEVQYIPTEASESVVIRLNRNDGALIVS